LCAPGRPHFCSFVENFFIAKQKFQIIINLCQDAIFFPRGSHENGANFKIAYPPFRQLQQHSRAQCFRSDGVKTTTIHLPVPGKRTYPPTIMKSHTLVVLLILIGSVSAFSVLPQAARPQQRLTRLEEAAKKKGFSNAEPKKSTKKSTGSPPAVQQPLAAVAVEPALAEKKPQSTTTEQQQQLNAGQRALEEMRRQRAEEKDAELRRVRELVQADEQLSEAPASIPEPVAQRMGKRMLPFVGLPLFAGMGAFVAFWYFATYKNVEFQPVLVAGSTIGILVVGLMVHTRVVMCWNRIDRKSSAVCRPLTLDCTFRNSLGCRALRTRS
jgi:Photosynthesis affected mutant 68